MCYRRILRIPWTTRRTNAILRKLNIQQNICFLPTIQRRIFAFFGHVIRRDGIGKVCIQGKIDDKKKRWRSLVRYIDQIRNMTNLSVPEIMQIVEDKEM